jgi:hypothetical protein
MDLPGSSFAAFRVGIVAPIARYSIDLSKFRAVRTVGQEVGSASFLPDLAPTGHFKSMVSSAHLASNYGQIEIRMYWRIGRRLFSCPISWRVILFTLSVRWNSLMFNRSILEITS